MAYPWAPVIPAVPAPVSAPPPPVPSRSSCASACTDLAGLGQLVDALEDLEDPARRRAEHAVGTAAQDEALSEQGPLDLAHLVTARPIFSPMYGFVAPAEPEPLLEPEVLV